MRAVPLAVFLIASPLVAAEHKIHRDLPYVEPKNERQTLDVYAPTEGKDHPVVIWIHGGGWRQGDKAGVQRKPRAFVEKGFVFVSINYRFVPQVTVKEMMGDVAKAILWVHNHATEYGGDPNSILVMGHSAGAHLAALVCTDNRFLKAEGLTLAILKGCVPVDTAAYDIPKRLKDSGSAAPDSFKAVFGETDEGHRDLSPATHVGTSRNIPPFLILHVADRPDSKAQSEHFAKVLKEAGVAATVVPGEGKTHGTINSELGLPDDKPTKALFEFLSAAISRGDPALSEPSDKLKKLGARITLDDQGRVVGVNLGERRVTDADLLHLRGLQHLRELDLTRTKVTSAGLANVKDSKALRTLFLTETMVDDSGIIHLKGMKALGLVGLSGTKITDAALDHLQELAGLEKVFCLGTGVTDAGVEKLRRALPQCQITH